MMQCHVHGSVFVRVRPKYEEDGQVATRNQRIRIVDRDVHFARVVIGQRVDSLQDVAKVPGGWRRVS